MGHLVFTRAQQPRGQQRVLLRSVGGSLLQRYGDVLFVSFFKTQSSETVFIERLLSLKST